MTDAQVLKLINNLDRWLDVINDASSELELHIADEKDRRFVEKLDKVIDDMYNLLQELKKGANKWIYHKCEMS